MKTDTKTLIKALRILAEDIESGDGVANACIAEAADKLEEFEDASIEMKEYLAWEAIAKKTLGVE